MGQKWGIRRFQPYPKNYHGNGKLAGEAARRANAKRHKVIAKATLAGINMKSSKKQYAKAVEKTIIENTKESKANAQSAKRNYEYWQNEYKRRSEKAEKVVQGLQKKYGKENIADIPYKDSLISGKVFTTKELLTKSAIAAALVVTGPLVPGPGAAMAFAAMPSKRVAALNEKVRTQRKAGLQQQGSIEKGIDLAQKTTDEITSKLKQKLKK